MLCYVDTEIYDNLQLEIIQKSWIVVSESC